MKHLSALVLGTALLLAPASVAHAQDATYLTPFIGFVHDEGSSPVIGGSALFKLDPVSFEADLGFAWDGEDIGDASTSTRGLTLMANAVKTIPTGTAIEPYVLGGLGIVYESIDLDEIGLGSDSETKLGFDVGGGAFFSLNERIAARGDVRYIRPFAGDDSLLDDVDFVRVTGGITFKF